MKNKLMFLIISLIAVGGWYLIFNKSINNPLTTQTNQENQTSNSSQITSDDCSGVPTPNQTEGPYYKTGSPKTNNVAIEVNGEKLTVIGFVFDKNCKPIANAWLDFWQADAKGVYDNVGFRLRGHQFTNENGKYELQTIMPSDYESRPPHIHVKVRVGSGPALTTQLYFPDEEQNQTDSIFNQDLIMSITDGEGGKIGNFNFVLP